MTTAETGNINAALSNPREDMAKLDELERKLFSLRYALGEIGSLGPVIDPPKATEERAEATAVLANQETELLLDPEVGYLLNRLEENASIIGQTRRYQVKILKRDREALLGIPAEEQEEFCRLTVTANDVWRRAKAANDWESFEPYLDRVVAALVSMAQHAKPDMDPYDFWLDQHEHGADRSLYDTFFSQVKDCVVPLLADCMASSRQPDARVVAGDFDERRQWELASDVLDLEGVDRDALWLGKTEHPFTGGPSTGFVIIAGHAYESNVLSNVFSMLHEGGHTMYEQSVSPDYRYTSLRGGTSAAMHEAQSRFFENYVGRSEAFSEQLVVLLRKHFPGQLGRLTARQLYMAENKATPCLIRCDADELTYPLHIIVRYEIEQLLFSGEAKAADVPGLWSERYKKYLGINVPDYTHGALQDTHWSDGDFGYFPTYALGGAYGAQLKVAMERQGVDFDGACASGDLAPIRNWLSEKIWKWGRAKDSAELIMDATGEEFRAKYYTDYLTKKFSAIYGL
ncbi:MAG: carboxypeptidase M32 [Tractidigestivibacter sp.]|jgi:carboxypeptidase Taq|uniref:carboxypeptidase M32 n=1 Tax=Tractidigestivibacter sp. TaxID=2847320 RepID=UPI003D8FE15E